MYKRKNSSKRWSAEEHSILEDCINSSRDAITGFKKAGLQLKRSDAACRVHWYNTNNTSKVEKIPAVQKMSKPNYEIKLHNGETFSLDIVERTDHLIVAKHGEYLVTIKH